MKVKDYDYEYDDFEEEKELSDERKETLIKKIKNYIRKGNIALYRILQICKTEEEYNFIYNWLEQNKITIGGTAVSLSGEFENYRHIPKMGQSYIPDVLEEAEQERLFNELDNLKKKGLNSQNSKEYVEIRNKLIEHNMRLARWIASSKYLSDLNLEKEDKEQLAMEALIKTVDQYDISYGRKFSTYAVPSIYYRLKNTRKNDEKFKIQLDSEWKRIEKYEEQLLKDENRLPTDEEIKEFLGISDKRLATLKNYINYQNQESFEHLDEDDEDSIIGQLLDDERIEELEEKPIINGVYKEENERREKVDLRNLEETAMQHMLKQNFEEILDGLTEREKKVLKLRFGLEGGRELTLEEIGYEFGVTGETIRRIEAKALRKLRHPSRTKILRDYINNDDVLEIYDIEMQQELTDRNQVVDGIKIETYNPNDNNIKKPTKKVIKDDELKDEENKEEIVDLENVENTEDYTELYEEMEQKDKTQTYLDEITALLNELKDLDIMLKQTSIEIKDEKEKKKRNAELKAKMKKIEDTIQK